MNTENARERFIAAHKLLLGETTTVEKFESVRTLIQGINPKVDKALNICTKAFEQIENLRKGEIIELSAKNLPEETEGEKKRKKAILFLIKTWKELKSEVERINAALEDQGKGKTTKEQMASFGKIAAFAKGPFGIITLLALIIVGALVFLGKNRQHNQTLTMTPTPILRSTLSPVSSSNIVPTPSPSKKIKTMVIDYRGKKIPLDQLRIGRGPDCTERGEEVSHYHAKDGEAVKALDGSTVSDPGACAFGKVSEVPIQEVESWGF